MLQKVVDGTATDLAAPVDNGGSNPGQVNSETTWYTYKVELSGTSIKVYVDNVLKFDITDSTYSTGTAGVYLSAMTDSEFDNALGRGHRHDHRRQRHPDPDPGRLQHDLEQQRHDRDDRRCGVVEGRDDRKLRGQ
jgi:hypothetical protein